MSGPQYIFLILTAIVTWGSLVESTAHPGYKLTVGRFALALALPLAMAALCVLLPWSEWMPVAPRWLGLLSPLLLPVAILALITVPPGFVFLIVLWVSSATTGEVRALLRSPPHRIFKRGAK